MKSNHQKYLAISPQTWKVSLGSRSNALNYLWQGRAYFCQTGFEKEIRKRCGWKWFFPNHLLNRDQWEIKNSINAAKRSLTHHGHDIWWTCRCCHMNDGWRLTEIDFKLRRTRFQESHSFVDIESVSDECNISNVKNAKKVIKTLHWKFEKEEYTWHWSSKNNLHVL